MADDPTDVSRSVDDDPSGVVGPEQSANVPVGDSGGWWSTRAEFRSFAELLGLTGLAITQPVLSTFGRDAGPFVSLRAGTIEIVAFALIVVFAPPVGLWAMERIVGFVGDAPRRWLHLGFVALLTALFVAKSFFGPLGLFSVLLVVAAPVGAVVLVARTEKARQFLRYLAFAPLVFMVLFLGFSQASSVAFGSDPKPAGPIDAENLPPIVMIVLDELPMSALLDGEGNIDADAYPGLAALAEDSTFARNHTTLSPITLVAVPTILTGRIPHDTNALPTARAHPENLFTMLGSDYRIRAVEHVTEMCPSSICETFDTVESSRTEKLVTLLRMVSDVFTASILYHIGFEDVDPAPAFEWLTESSDEEQGGPTLDYLHSLLPHQNWRWLPDGHEYEAPDPPTRRWPGQVTDDEALARLARQRQQLQTAYADELVGETMDDLRAKGVYDDALIIVTSDHGVSFRPDEPMRPLSEGNVNDIMWTPLLVKVPHQDEARVIDSPTASIDVVPTIVDVLGLDTPWDLDGRSVLGPPRSDDWDPRSLAFTYDELEPGDDGFVHVDGARGFAEVIESRAFDFGADWDLRLWRWGDNGDLVGREVDSFEQGKPADLTASIDAPERFTDVDASDRMVPAYVSGRVIGGEPEAVAVAVNGVIGGWYDMSEVPNDETGRPFAVMVPPSLLRDGDNDVEVFLIEGSGDDRRLVATRPGR